MAGSEFLRDTWQTSLVFLSLLVFTRILGNTQIGQLTLYEYISGITIGSIAANVAAADPDKTVSHYYDLVLFVLLTYLISHLTIRSRRLRKLIDGSPTVVIENGRIMTANMGKLRYDLDELNGQLRQQGILDPAEVQYAVVETSGNLSVIKKSDYQTVTRSDIKLASPDPTFPLELIMDGEVIFKNLQGNYSLDWLNGQLASKGITGPDKISYAAIDSKGKLYISPTPLPTKSSGSV
ncbi:DUF421 domain-containing protein [Propionispora vibrioides]|jgi:uncharacterized membrane protein YcaP (DUF421 family)|uniref:Uncharacterized membrane protein YcaP, DUF421 family n=1 Tax=Propionispora vibrioides TaxID=112903 RepID=A0A1H8Q5Z6_9FIRM|nr:DUF421 domain-containing protein [Propionispora vibrioides]SEO49173.1 Uncharacterized membrane protein YcaP, DUF421 family [Propionispora vibrioides]